MRLTCLAFRNDNYASLFKASSLRRAPLHSKARHADHVKRARRQRYFFDRRLEYDRMREPAALEHGVTTRRINSIAVFGRPLSQRPGDGGVIPYLMDAADGVAHVREYFNISPDASGPVVDLCIAVARDPTTTHGAFKGTVPVANRPFYEQAVLQEEEIEFNRAADYHEGMPPLAPDLDDNEREHRFYSGLYTEIAFKHLPRKHVEELRAMEIEAKQGRFDASKMRRAPRRGGANAPSGPDPADVESFPFLAVV
ncbi:signal peptide-containing protein [Babesia caballi]|uniref:Signal peptide-containing protein n=1 Tax=Babesia caballi TaxID=5871 RepID=A0AAV4LM11_BABCB|nr:signal peptide-containing protein [Babesia caballi]